jgi:glycosyltransferase involved in cell wall biosynthesis
VTPAKKKVVYVVSNIHKSLAFEWTATALKEHVDLTFVLLNPSDSILEKFLQRIGVNTVRIKYRGKRDLPAAFLRLFVLLLRERPAIVHTHLFDATLIGLAAGRMAGVKKRIYTRHNSTFHHLYFPKSVKYDLWSNRLSTHIISISEATDTVLLQMENVSAEKLRKIHHGFDLKSFEEVDARRVSEVRDKWRLKNANPCVGVVARHIEWKGIQYIIPAFKSFLRSHPNAVLVLANSTGPYHSKIVKLLEGIPEQQVVMIPFEEDISALYKTFDIYIHTPIDSTCEAFGQTYVEALASGVPSIFSLSGIASEFIEDRVNALVVKFRDHAAIETSLEQLWENEELRKRIIKNGREAVFSRFKLTSMIEGLRKLYDE